MAAGGAGQGGGTYAPRQVSCRPLQPRREATLARGSVIVYKNSSLKNKICLKIHHTGGEGKKPTTRQKPHGGLRVASVTPASTLGPSPVPRDLGQHIRGRLWPLNNRHEPGNTDGTLGKEELCLPWHGWADTAVRSSRPREPGTLPPTRL